MVIRRGRRFRPKLSRDAIRFGWSVLAVGFGLVLFALAGADAASAQSDGNRVALLIANGAYPEAGPSKKTAAKDAALLADELRRDAFDLDLQKDLGRDALRNAIDAFLAKLKPGSTALLYFNGIGIQVARQTYLIPVNAEIWSEADVKREGISIDAVVADMARRGAVVKILIIDASKPNPFERHFRSFSAGLASVDAPEGTLVMYAAAPNKVGAEATGGISLLMNELVKELRTPNISAEDAILHTRVGVSRASNGEQVPWFASSLVEPVYLGQSGDQAPSDGTPTPPPPRIPPVANAPVASPPPIPAPPPEPPKPAPEPPKPATEPPKTVVKTPPPEPPKPSPEASKDAPKDAPKTAEKTPPSPKPVPEAPPPSTPEPAPKPVSKAPTTATPAPSDPKSSLPTTPAKDIDTTPGTNFRDCPDCPEMTVLPSGSFLMGAGTTPFDRPIHKVTFAKPFAMARNEVTFADWQRCFAAGACTTKPDSQGFGEGQHPVINVSWNDAKEYVAWLSKTTGKTYRLPSEAEWEYAARAGTSTAFSWGPTVGSHMANCADCGGDGPPHTEPVRSFAPNAFGLYDMAGNAAEWVEDCWNTSYRGAPKDGSPWLAGTCEQRVLRGGSFDGGSMYAKSAARFRYDADVRYWANGFRVLRELP